MLNKYDDLVIIKKFKEKIQREDLISQHDIKDLESKIGSNFITKKYRLPMFSIIPDTRMVKETIILLNDILKSPEEHVVTEGLLSADGGEPTRELIDSYKLKITSRPSSIFKDFLEALRLDEGNFSDALPLHEFLYIGDLTSYDFETGTLLGNMSLSSFIRRIISFTGINKDWERDVQDPNFVNLVSKLLKYHNLNNVSRALSNLLDYYRNDSTSLRLSDIFWFNYCIEFVKDNLELAQELVKSWDIDSSRSELGETKDVISLVGDSTNIIVSDFIQKHMVVNPLFSSEGYLLEGKDFTLFGYDFMGRVVEFLARKGWGKEISKACKDIYSLSSSLNLYFSGSCSSNPELDKAMSYFDNALDFSYELEEKLTPFVRSTIKSMFTHYYRENTLDFKDYSYRVSFFQLLSRLAYYSKAKD